MFSNRLHTIAVADINIVGLEDNQVRAFQIELVPKLNLYDEIHKAYKKLGRMWQKVVDALPSADYLLLKDLVGDEETPKSHMELEHAKLAR